MSFTHKALRSQFKNQIKQVYLQKEMKLRSFSDDSKLNHFVSCIILWGIHLQSAVPSVHSSSESESVEMSVEYFNTLARQPSERKATVPPPLPPPNPIYGKLIL
jgi:hypothetical protein